MARPLLAALAAASLCCGGTAHAQQIAGAPAATTLRPVEGTAISLIPPPGFRESNASIPGFIDAKGASITVLELPASALPGLPSSAGQIKRGAEWRPGSHIVADGETWALGGGASGIYMSVEGRSSGAPERTQILVIRTGGMAILVMATLPADSATPFEAMKASLRTVHVSDKHVVNAKLARLPFTIGDRAGLRLTMTDDNTAAFTDGPLDTDPSWQQPAMAISFKNTPGLGGKRAKETARTLFQSGFPHVTITSERYDSRSGVHRVDGTGQQDGIALHYTLIIAFPDTGVLFAICIYRPEINFADRCARVARTMAVRS